MHLISSSDSNCMKKNMLILSSSHIELPSVGTRGANFHENTCMTGQTNHLAPNKDRSTRASGFAVPLIHVGS